ncbi:hypothetical protein H5410_057027, partial [Solanum commersonii]
MSTQSLGHQSSDFGFTTSLSGKPKTHGWLCICNYKPFKLNHNHQTHFQLREEELLSSGLYKTLSKLEKNILAKVYCAAEDCSATLVEIADELGDSPFGQLIAFSVLPLASSHSRSLGGFAYWNEGRFMSFRRLTKLNSTICKISFLVLFNPICSILRLSCLAFSILAFWIIGWYSTTSQNLSVTRRLLFSSPFDRLPSRLHVLERRAVHVILVTRQVKLGVPQDSISCSFQPYLLRFAP